MPRYQMHLDGVFSTLGENGEIYASLDFACVDAIRFLIGTLRDRASEIQPGDTLGVDLIDDENHRVVKINASVISVARSHIFVG